MAIEKLNLNWKNKGETGYENSKMNKTKMKDITDKVDELVDFSNSVIESGTNYVKFKDGTMICYGNIEFNIGNMNQRSPFWQYQNNNLSIPFSQTFISKPNIVASIVAGNYASLLYVIDCSINAITSITILTLADSSQQKTNINYMAIGKWK